MGDLMMRWLKLSLVALVACGFIGMVVYALYMRDEIRSAQVEPALVSPPETAVKRRPDEPGGMAIPNRDKLVFDLLDEASTGVSAPAPAPVAGAVEQLPLAGAATPTVVVSAATTMAMATSTTSVPGIKTAASQEAPKEVKLQPQQIAPIQAAHPAPAAVVAQATPTPTPAPAEATPQLEPAPKAEPKPAVKAAVTPKAATGGNFGVQVSAVSSQTEAAKMAGSIQAKNAPLKGLTITTPSAGNGKWRVQFVGLASRAAAAKVCTQLGSKQPCFPISAK